MIASPEEFQRAKQLREEIRRHNRAYYDLASPEISDEEYDKLFHELEELELKFPELKTPDSPTQKVGAPPKAELRQIRHSIPMGSIKSSETYDDSSAERFDRQIRDALGVKSVEYDVELKFDGVAISLRYELGSLRFAATRGDGETGEDVTENVRAIDDIPKRLVSESLPRVLEVRGEIFMTREDFESFNETQRSKGLETLTNPRNAAAGSIRQVAPSLSAQRRLSFFAYGLGETVGWQRPSKQSEVLDALLGLGFPVCSERAVVIGLTGLLHFRARIGAKRQGLPFDIDGVVYKVDSLSEQLRLGETARRPRWALAHKFEPEERQTKLLEIEVQVGRTGVLTPVAKLSEVFVGGANVSSAQLFNQSVIAQRDLRIGDTVVVRRAGDVIPQIVSSVPSLRTGNEKLFQMPDTCPVCQSRVVWDKDHLIARCSGGLYCPAQRKEAIKHFASRNAMDIQGLGDSVVGQLVERGAVKTIANLYGLKLTDLIELDRFAEKSGDKLLKQIGRSKDQPLHRLIFALGIPEVGEATAKEIAKFFGSIEAIQSAPRSAFLLVPDVGFQSADSIWTFFRQKHNEEVLSELAPHFSKIWKGSRQFRARQVSTGELLSVLRPIELDEGTGRLKAKGDGLGGNGEKAISAHFLDPTVLLRCAPETVSDKCGIAEKRARAAIERVQGEEGRALVEALERLGALGMSEEVGPQKQNQTLLFGKTFVVTGTLPTLSREEAKERIEAAGGQFSTSVSKRTDFVVCGESPGSKLADAERLGVPIIGEDSLLAMLTGKGR